MASADDKVHYVEPFDPRADADAALDLVTKLIRELPRTTIKVESPGYLHAEFRTRIFRFCDDVEFLADATADPPVLHVRSGSRLGYFDFHANRKRVEKLRELYEQSLASEANAENGAAPERGA